MALLKTIAVQIASKEKTIAVRGKVTGFWLYMTVVREGYWALFALPVDMDIYSVLFLLLLYLPTCVHKKYVSNGCIGSLSLFSIPRLSFSHVCVL